MYSALRTTMGLTRQDIRLIIVTIIADTFAKIIAIIVVGVIIIIAIIYTTRYAKQKRQ
jgi:hypothetical protein